MTPMCGCCAAAPVVTITGDGGRHWTFENTRMFGPLLLRADGEPAARQPGTRSAFWPAFERWQAEHRKEHRA